MRQEPRDPIRSPRGPEEIRRVGRSTVLATGTLACPDCDAPVSPGTRSLAPSDALSCPFCGRAGAVREFLSLTAPARPAKVVVHVLAPGLRPRVRAQS